MADLLWVYSASRSHVGRKRKNNEDSVASFEPDDLEEIETKGQLYIVADGVGGAMKGEKASQYAASKVLYDFFQKTHADPGKSLSTSMQQVNADIYNYSHTEAHYGKMATTMVAAAIFHNNLVVANVGDSRAYLIRDGVTKQITRDHNIAAELVLASSGMMRPFPCASFLAYNNCAGLTGLGSSLPALNGATNSSATFNGVWIRFAGR